MKRKLQYTRNSKRVKDLIKAVSHVTGLDPKEWMSTTRTRENVTARFIFFYLCRKKVGMTLVNCGELMGKDHSTVIHAVENVEYWKSFPKLYEEEMVLYTRIMMEYAASKNDSTYTDVYGGVWERTA